MSRTMAETPLPVERREQIFPRLTDAQLQRIEHYGTRRVVQDGEILFRQGDEGVHFYVILSGELDVVRPDGEGESLIVRHQPGNFTGETAMLSGRRALATGRFRGSGEVVDIPPSALRNLVVTDAELSELLMRAFILRRVSLISNHLGDAVVLGSRHCARTLGIREFLERNGHPYLYLDVEQDEGARALVERFQIGPHDIPVLICRGTKVLRAPSNAEVADCLGFNAGSAPMRCATWSSWGRAGGPRRPRCTPPARAWTSSCWRQRARRAGRVQLEDRELPRLPHRHLGAGAGRASVHPGPEVRRERGDRPHREGLDCSGRPYALELETASGSAPGRSSLRAARATGGWGWRTYPVRECRRVLRSDLRRIAGSAEGEEAIVIGGGNSAGQAAVYLSGIAATCTCWCAPAASRTRCPATSSAASRRARRSPSAPGTEIVGLDGRPRADGSAMAERRHRRDRGATRCATCSA